MGTRTTGSGQANEMYPDLQSADTEQA